MLSAGRLFVLSFAFAGLVGCGTGEIDVNLGQFAEDCQNQRDDDGDGLVDCSDDACSATAACADIQPREALTPDFQICGTSSGDRSQFPVDMIWLLDNSVSMQKELSWIANNLNDMDGFLREKRANVRVVLVGAPDLCIAPPLGGTNCGNSDRLLHVKEKVGNQETLRMGVDLYPKFSGFLRQGAKRVFVAVSDDNPNPRLKPAGWPEGVTAESFRDHLNKLDSAFSNIVFHSIVGYPEDGGRHPTGCAGAQRLGQTYLELTEETGGMKFSVCNNRQGEWQDFLDELATRVAGLVNVPCSYPAELALEDGRKTNSGQIFGEAEIDGNWQPLTQLPDASTCNEQRGWYMASGHELRVCPSVCGSPEVTQVRFHHGCPAAIGPD